MISRAALWSIVVSVLSILPASQGMAQDPSEPRTGGREAAGTFAPAGPPLEQPTRVDAGGSCIVHLRQAYDVSGTLSGSLEIDYRIIVHGPCATAVPGTNDEEWIAYGVFTGVIDGTSASGDLTYTAHVQAGGDVEGRLVLGGGIRGALVVTGNFGDGKLAYRGEVN